MLLPPLGDWRAEPIGWLDGLVLSGGADVDPARYGQAPAPPHRARAAAPGRGRVHPGPGRAGQPGCRCSRCAAALQVLNVALGGTLHQHLPDLLGSDRAPARARRVRRGRDRRGAGQPRWPGSSATAASVRCHHHQAVDQLGDGLAWWRARATASSRRSSSATGFALGVQCHPEQDGEDVRLFARAGPGGPTKEKRTVTDFQVINPATEEVVASVPPTSPRRPTRRSRGPAPPCPRGGPWRRPTAPGCCAGSPTPWTATWRTWPGWRSPTRGTPSATPAGRRATSATCCTTTRPRRTGCSASRSRCPAG